MTTRKDKTPMFFPFVSNIAKVEQTGPKTIVFTLKAPQASFPTTTLSKMRKFNKHRQALKSRDQMLPAQGPALAAAIPRSRYTDYSAPENHEKHIDQDTPRVGCKPNFGKQNGTHNVVLQIRTTMIGLS